MISAGQLDRSDFYVYAHRRIGSDVPFYVGKGCGRRSAKTNSRNPHWRNIVAKDGGYSTLLIAEAIDEELAFLAEIETIDVLRRRGVQLVNLTNGGDGVSGLRHTEERKRILSGAMKGNQYGLGRRHSDEAKKKIGLASIGRIPVMKGKKFNDAQLVNIRKSALARRGKPRSAETVNKLRGLVRSDETRLKISMAVKGLPKSAEHRAKIGARIWTAEQRRAAGDRARGNTYRRGGVLSDEARAKISAAKLGSKHSLETREKMSAAQKGRPKSPEHIAKVAAAMLGKKASIETRIKLSLAHRGKRRAQCTPGL